MRLIKDDLYLWAIILLYIIITWNLFSLVEKQLKEFTQNWCIAEEFESTFCKTLKLMDEKTKEKQNDGYK